MTRIYDYYCIECGYDEAEGFFCDGDGPIFCPECRGADTIEPIDPTPYETDTEHREPKTVQDEHGNIYSVIK